MKRNRSIDQVRVSLNDGLTILDLKPGNTTTLAHYLDLLGGAGLLVGLAKFSGRAVRQRGVDKLRTSLCERVAQRQLAEVIQVRDRIADRREYERD